MKKEFIELKKLIAKSKNVVITTHLIPDGDAIGSEFAMYCYLKSKKKNVTIINHSITPDNLVFLDPEKIIRVFLKEKEKNERLIDKADIIFVLDTNEYSRTKTMEEHIRKSKAKKICIDHHLGTQKSAYDLIISNTNYPATSQILYELLIKERKNIITPFVATALYAGIMTDTGSFRYPRTDEKTFLICADLIKKGADPVYIYDKAYCNIAPGKVQLLSRFINSFSFHFNGEVVIGRVTQKDFCDFHSDVQDVEGFSSFLMNLKNVKAGFVLVELKDSIKMSFRSKGNISINEFAKLFGGGGHKNAAGATVPRISLNELEYEIVKRFSLFRSLHKNDPA
ncbi:MAG: bifunctional oligoribonuclease/PAP phosphatase NrnA [Ignavibacteriae bacterium]|nr:bifunctional oligoribonuclease/PAP phosphatase NrnA [Ignavibacteriota bacterium]